MPIISTEEVKEFLTSGTFDLQPTQMKFCLPILQRIHHKMKLGVEFGNINVAEGLLIEGHHRFICSLLLQKPIGRNAWQKTAFTVVFNWSNVKVDENDWESIEIIQRHNEKDAAKSGIDIKLLEL